jgi:uncharacterized protein involved in response to NO
MMICVSITMHPRLKNALFHRLSAKKRGKSVFDVVAAASLMIMVIVFAGVTAVTKRVVRSYHLCSQHRPLPLLIVGSTSLEACSKPKVLHLTQDV